jgi:DNA-binding transcriptional LysR family regulator
MRNRSYKKLTLQQFRSLYETAQQGSFLAAAAALKLSQPTIWKQVHALEREFAVKLVEPHGRGCTLTAAGRRLVEMIGPAVESMASVRERFRADLAGEGEQLTVAVTPRMLVDEIAPCLRAYHTQFPKTRFTFLELSIEEVPVAVLKRHADLGFTPAPLTAEQLDLLSAEPVYALEVRLIAPKDHPLARRRVVRLHDLGRYPILNRPGNVPHPLARAFLDLHGARRVTSCLVHAGLAASIRCFVKMGYGIGFITVPACVPPDPELHERSLRRHFEDLNVHLIRRRGSFIPTAGEEFIRFLRQELGAGLPQRDRGGS